MQIKLIPSYTYSQTVKVAHVTQCVTRSTLNSLASNCTLPVFCSWLAVLSSWLVPSSFPLCVVFSPPVLLQVPRDCVSPWHCIVLWLLRLPPYIWQLLLAVLPPSFPFYVAVSVPPNKWNKQGIIGMRFQLNFLTVLVNEEKETIPFYNPPINFCGVSLAKTDHEIQNRTIVIRR